MALLTFILQNPGKVYSLLMMAMEAVQAGVDWIELQNFIHSKLDPALKKAKDDKDPVDLENIFRK